MIEHITYSYHNGHGPVETPTRHVLFRFPVQDNHLAFQITAFISQWLEENATDYTIQTFQCNQLIATIDDEQARLMLKLTFEPYGFLYYGDDMYTDDPGPL